jgi:hypothetical protein
MGSLNPFAKPKTKEMSNVPEWVRQKQMSLYDKAESVSGQDFTPYSGPRVAPYGANLQDAEQAARASGASDIGSTYFDPARSMIQSSPYKAGDITTKKFGAEALQQYMNPYVQGALDPVIRQLSERGEKTQSDIGRKAGMRGAFGGGRHAILESEAAKGTEQAIADVLSKGYRDAYGKAAGMFTTDEQRALEAAKAQEAAKQSEASTAAQQAAMLASLGQAYSGISTADIDRLLKTGGVGQQYRQSEIEADREAFEEKQGVSERQLDVLLKTINAIQGGSVSHVAQPSKFSRIAKGIGDINNLGKTVMSDIRVKQNIKKVGEEGGYNVYEFEYKDSPGRFRGVMAQEVKRKNPEAIVQNDNGMMMVNYENLPVTFKKIRGI